MASVINIHFIYITSIQPAVFCKKSWILISTTYCAVS